MVGEFEQSVLSEAEAILASGEGRDFEVEISANLATSVLAYVQIAQAHMIGLEREGRPNEESNVWSLVQRFKEAIPHEQRYDEVPVGVFLNWRDVDFIGRIMRVNPRRSAPIFLQLNDAFLKSGGKDNDELSALFSSMKIVED